jgi:hypothetical protein
MKFPFDAYLYELWSQGLTYQGPPQQFSNLTASVLSYGPRGCGKTFLAERFFTLSGITPLVLDAVDILKRPERVRKILPSAKAAVLIEGIDNLFVSLRQDPPAHRFLLDWLKDPATGSMTFATALRPEMILPIELDTFTYVLPVFYGDQGLREIMMVSHAEQVPLDVDVDLLDISARTEWWSAHELKELMTETRLDERGILTVENLIHRIALMGSNIVPSQRRKRTQELFRFTADHCTSNYIREDISFRYGPDFTVSETVPELPRIVIEELHMEIKQAGVVIGPGGKAKNIKFKQVLNEASPLEDLPKLAEGLATLRAAIEREPEVPEKHVALEAVKSAEEEAKKGNGQKVLGFLAKAGEWTLKVATKIGVGVAEAAIKQSLGLE